MINQNKQLTIIIPPGEGWADLFKEGNITDTIFISDINYVTEPDNQKYNQILYFANKGDYQLLPFSQLYDGTVLDSIPSSWHSAINNGNVHIIINTSEESWGPIYDNKINHVESANVHITLELAADRLGINPSQITWVTGDLNAETYCKGSRVNVKSVCWFKHSLQYALYNGQADYQSRFKNDNMTPDNFMIFLNRFPKSHRAYVSARIWELKKTYANSHLHNIIWSLPKELYGSNICKSYLELHYKNMEYSNTFDTKNIINWPALRDNILDLYYYLPFVADNIDKDTNNCAAVDALDSIHAMYNSSAFSLVTETWAEGGKLFISEATFMSILYGVPFLVIGNSGILHKLREFGFKTYSDIIDESYDLIEDDVERWEAVITEVHRLSQLSSDEYIQLYRSVKEISHYNYKKLFEVAQQAEQELYDWMISL
jgi:hypothetical protein